MMVYWPRFAQYPKLKSPMTRINRTLPLLTAILILAASIRILHIGDQSLWIDEGATYFILQQPDLITALQDRDHHPLLYYLMLEGWIGLAGGSVVAMRMFSAFFSILSVAAVVPLAKVINRGRPWFQDASVPILAALMLTLSDPEVVLAQEIRMYALRTFLVILSVLFYLRWTYKPSVKRALPWLIVSVTVVHVQYQGLYILAVEGLHALLFLRGRTRVAAVGWLVGIGLLCAPWFLAVGLSQRDNDPGIQASLPSNWATMRDLIGKFLSGQWALLLGLLLLGTVAVQPSERRGEKLERGAEVPQGEGFSVRVLHPFAPTFLLVTWIAFTVIVTFLLNLLFPVLAPHRILLISPALAILIAQGLRNFQGVGRLVLVAVIVVYGLATVDDYYPKEPWDKMAASMALYARPDQMALLEVYRGDNPLTYYLDQWMPAGTNIQSLRHWREFWPDRYPQDVLDMLPEYNTVWLAHWSPDQSAFGFLSDFNRTALLTTDHWGNQLNVYRYDRIGAGEVAAYTSGMTLKQVELNDDIRRVDLWWTAAERPALDYTVSVFLLDSSGALVVQHDSFPFENRRPTTSWDAGEIIYDPHPLPAAPPGEYQVGVQVYTYFDGQRYPLTTGEPWAIVGTLSVSP
jgi:mannosyltransferase